MDFTIRPRSLLTTLAELVGFGAVSAGVWWIFAPAGLITAGISLVLIGFLAA